MKKTVIVFVIFISLIIGIGTGWISHQYWDREVGQTKSLIALANASNAEKKGNIDQAIEYTKYALMLDNESPLADIQLKELKKRRNDKIAAELLACGGKKKENNSTNP